MATYSQMKFDWTGTPARLEVTLPDSSERPREMTSLPEQCDEPCATAPSLPPITEGESFQDDLPLPSTRAPFPCPEPLPEAVENKAFGEDENGEGIHPDEEEVAVITRLRGEKLIAAVDRIEEVDELLREVNTPNRAELVRRKDIEHSAYMGLIALYAEDFGPKAARELEAWAHDQRDHGEGEFDQYDPGHPWHYYAQGDNATPLPVDEIPPARQAGLSFEASLPKSAAKRREKLNSMLTDQQQQLDRDQERYQELVDRGAEALGYYDRNIAHGGNDELAWASALALKYNHIRNGLGRVAWLQEQLKKRPAAKSRRRRSGGVG